MGLEHDTALPSPDSGPIKCWRRVVGIDPLDLPVDIDPFQGLHAHVDGAQWWMRCKLSIQSVLLGYIW